MRSALGRLDLLSVVAKHKAVYFRSAWARYDLARPGELRLLPAPGREAALASDYAKMRPIFFGELRISSTYYHRLPSWRNARTANLIRGRFARRSDRIDDLLDPQARTCCDIGRPEAELA